MSAQTWADVVAQIDVLREATDEATVASIQSEGNSAFAREDYVAAAHSFRKLALLRSDEAMSWLSLAACHDAADDPERAAALYRLAELAPYADEPQRALAALCRGRLLVTLGRRAEAVEALKSALAHGLPKSERRIAQLLLDTEEGVMQ